SPDNQLASCACLEMPSADPRAKPIKILYSTMTGGAKNFAEQLHNMLLTSAFPATIVNVVDYETEDFFNETATCIFILAAYNVESPSGWLLKWLDDTRLDFRVDRYSLNKICFAVFGLGDSGYSDDFCLGPRNVDKWMGQLGARRIYPLGESDKQD